MDVATTGRRRMLGLMAGETITATDKFIARARSAWRERPYAVERKEFRMAELGVEETDIIIERLLQIIADEGLVDRSKLDPHAQLDEIGVSADDRVLIGNAIEREFDRDILSDDEIEKCVTVRELVSLLAKRISEQNSG
ncbi:MAG: hypothetical protein KME20_26340 [Kaiparowitsia implicata GSE-PSE-MK54-09C]|jgi:acyl carrier protein|nr:hypothetical protein [Kaiparowitsia implicata GSE-PSE-MK54-09C]